MSWTVSNPQATERTSLTDASTRYDGTAAADLVPPAFAAGAAGTSAGEPVSPGAAAETGTPSEDAGSDSSDTEDVTKFSLPTLAVATFSAGVLFVMIMLLSSTVSPMAAPNNGRGSSSSRSESMRAASSDGRGGAASKDLFAEEVAHDAHATRVIPSMQPFSTVDPADAYCPHMDRPEV